LGTGFSDEQLKDLPEKLSPFATDERPLRVEVRDNVESDPRFTPEIVAELVAAEITESPVHLRQRQA